MKGLGDTGKMVFREGWAVVWGSDRMEGREGARKGGWGGGERGEKEKGGENGGCESWEEFLRSRRI